MDIVSLKRWIDEGKSTREIAKLTNKGQTTIRYWMNKYDLKSQLKQSNKGNGKDYICACGETNPSKFYGHKKQICGKCHNQYCIKRGHEKRKFARDLLGGKCVYCGFDKWDCSMDIHHTDPTKKDKTFNSMRGWSLARIEKEMKHCILLCKNCHAAYHSGLIKLNGGVANVVKAFG